MTWKTAVVGIGETTYYKRAQAPDPEFKMGLEAILLAAEDAGIDVREIDGILYANDGDWVEHGTALAETASGELTLLGWRQDFGRYSIPVRATA